MPGESALIIFIPEAEELVERFRVRYDPSAVLGVPAHVTVLYPFKPPREITELVLKKLDALFTKIPRFTTAFVEARRFPETLYLAPSPDDPFRRLTELVAEHFPETPPYGGQFRDIIPHLTVAQESDRRRLEEITTEFQQAAKTGLPIHANVTEIVMMDNESGTWHVRHRFSLGPTPSYCKEVSI